ncbi:MAG: glucosamine-6-phosphate deaminase [bacterium]|nr:glucosamine-6-phosphate deaminase [bacterium]
MGIVDTDQRPGGTEASFIINRGEVYPIFIPSLEVFEDTTFLNITAADTITSAITRNPQGSLLVPTGKTMVPIYEELRQLVLDYSNITLNNLDGYCGGNPFRKGMFTRYMTDNLIGYIDVPSGSWNIPDEATRDPQREVERYQQIIDLHQPADLAILGIGENGHIAFNEPGTPVDSGVHVVDLTEETRLANADDFGDINLVPYQAITIGIGDILQAKRILLVAKGEGKREAIQKMIYGPITTDVPASLLRFHPQVTIMMDIAAGRDIFDFADVRHKYAFNPPVGINVDAKAA